MPRTKGNPGSSEGMSDLIRLFFERSQEHSSPNSPEQVMESLVKSLPGGRIRNQEQRLQRALRERNIVDLGVCSEMDCDGVLEPVGATFAEGFRMRLRHGTWAARTRFSIAHEICHTFFYETVPEIKFSPHQTDEAEERLCNLGAACLLIPAGSLRAAAKKLPICLGSLQQLAEHYGVSLAAMLIRLSELRLWNCELSSWHPATNGGFTLDRLYGGRRAEWEWEDGSELEHAWHSSVSIFGTGFVHAVDARGSRRYRPVSYNVQRFGESVLALWGVGIRKPSKDFPLLRAIRRINA